MTESAQSVELDDFDRKILAILRKDGRITFTDLARQVGLSKTPCQQRVRRLVENGVISGFAAILDPKAKPDAGPVKEVLFTSFIIQ